MHTLIIAEHDYELHKSLFDPNSPVQAPRVLGQPGDALDIWDEGDPDADAVAGAESIVGACAPGATSSRIKQQIIEFAECCLSDERQHHRNDYAQMQVIFMFHRSHRQNVRTLIRGIRQLGRDKRWAELSDLYGIALRVARVVLLSCESGIEMNPADCVKYPTFMRQSQNLRIASAAAFRREKKPPPSNPPEYWDPFIYTFSTGNFLTGATVLDPNKVRFVVCPNNQLQGSGDDENAWMGAVPGKPDVAFLCPGHIYKYEGANYVSQYTVAAAGSFDIINDDF